ncbi:MAG: protein phosphatase 2C domain-containing protein [Lentisphaeraceae bacterium]|nr:protein phosphatase 2C domain-containing protein [Lentisphaeraceae bacterium]
MYFKAEGISHQGLVRDSNEDSYYIDSDKGIFIVCDGVGGGKAGEIASSLAINETVRYLEEEYTFLEECRSGKFKDDAVFRFAAGAVRHACKAVYDLGHKKDSCKGMATTLTMAIPVGARLLICHVGDSRAYLVNGDNAHQISEDHTLVKEFLKKGLINEEEEAAEYMHHTLTRSLGTYPSVEVDCVMISVTEGDKIVLCSDGVSNYITFCDELIDLVKDEDLETNVEALVSYALKNKGEDNATAIVMKVVDDQGISDYEYLQESLIMEVLQSSQIYSGLSYTQLARMRSHMEVVRLKKNEVLIQACEKYSGFFIVMDGGILSGDELMIRGEGIGLKALVRDHHCPEDKTAVRDTRLLYFSRKRFDNFSKRYPAITNQILKNIIKLI